MTDKTDDTTVEQLKERIEELEQQVNTPDPSRLRPSRRDVLAAAVGAVGLGALTGTASGATWSNSTGSIGTSSTPLSNSYIQTGEFQTVNTDEITTTTPSGVTTVASINPGGKLMTTDQFNLGDDASKRVLASFGAGDAGLIEASAIGDSRGVVATAVGSSVTIQEQVQTDWAASDTDGKNCLFRSGGDVVIKNRTGSAQDYRFQAVVLRD